MRPRFALADASAETPKPGHWGVIQDKTADGVQIIRSIYTTVTRPALP